MQEATTMVFPLVVREDEISEREQYLLLFLIFNTMEGLRSYSQDHAEPRVVETWETTHGTLLAQEKKAKTKRYA